MDALKDLLRTIRGFFRDVERTKREAKRTKEKAKDVVGADEDEDKRKNSANS